MTSGDKPDEDAGLEAEPIDAEFEPADPEPKRSGGALRVLAGAVRFVLFIAVAGAAGAGGAWLWGELRPDAPTPSEPSAGIETRLEALENTVSALSGLEARLNALEEREITDAVPAEALRAFDADIAALWAAIEALGARPDAPASDMPATARLEALEARLEEIVAETARALEAAQSASERASGTGEAQAVDLAPLERGQTALDDRLARLERRLDEEIGALDQRSAETRRAAGEAAAEVESTLLERIAALEDALDARERAAGADAAELQQGAARVLAFTALREAAMGEDPFEAERAALARLWRDAPGLADMQPLARSGVPALPTLREDFPARDIVAASGETRRFFGLFELRPAGTGADSTINLVAQGETRLERGDLSGAVEALARLEGASADAASDWLEAARARLALDNALARLRAALAAEIEAEG